LWDRSQERWLLKFMRWSWTSGRDKDLWQSILYNWAKLNWNNQSLHGWRKGRLFPGRVLRSQEKETGCVCKAMMYYPMSQKTFSQGLYDQSIADTHTHTHLKTSAVHSAELSEVSRETNTNSGDVCCGPTSCPKRAINLGKSPPSLPSNFTYGSFYHLQGTRI